MALDRKKIKRTRVGVETTFGADLTGTIGDLTDVRVTELETPREAAQDMIEDERVRSRRVMSSPSQLGFKNGTFTAGGALVSTGIEYNAAATPAQDTFSKILKAIIGGQESAAGSLVASGASPTGVTVTGTQGARFTEGKIIGVETGVGTGVFVCTGIDTRATDAITFTHSVGFTPAVGAKIINSDLFYETDQPSQTLQWLVEGEGSAAARNDIWLYKGCQGNLGIGWPLGKTVTWTHGGMFATRVHDAEIATPQGGAAMSMYSVPGSAEILATAGNIVFTPAAGTTRTTPKITDFTFDPAITWTPTTSFNGVEGRDGYERVTGQPMATITCSRKEAVETYKDAMEAQTLYRLMAQAGAAGGKIICLHLPSVQIVGIAPTDVNGLEYMTVSLKCLPDAGLTDQSTDVLRAPYRLARL